MNIKLGIVMDPIRSINARKDSSLAMLLAAQKRGWDLYYMEQSDLFLEAGRCHSLLTRLEVRDNENDWYTLSEQRTAPLDELDVILMRKDPPFNMEYVYTTYILDRAELAGALIVNAPQALRDMNEKAYTAWFPDCTPLTLVTRSMEQMKAFLAEHGRIVVKPLDGMGGRSIFVIQKGDNNANVIFETLTDYGQQFAMAQVFIPEITLGDKRILLIDGEPVPYALARIPTGDDNRGNIVAGATTKGQELSDADKRICAEVGPVLREQGILFAGIDVIGDYLTEINVTSPTCIREIDTGYDLDIAGQLMDCIAEQLNNRH